MYVCMYVLTSPPRLLNRIQPNFACPLGVTMAPWIKNIQRIEAFLQKICYFLTPRPYKLMYFQIVS